MKIGKKYFAKIFVAMCARILQKFRLQFARRDYRHSYLEASGHVKPGLANCNLRLSRQEEL